MHAHAVLDQPREDEETRRDEDAADVGEREAVFGQGLAVIARREGVVDGVDAGHEEEDGSEEAEAGPQVEEADLLGGELVGLLRVDVLHVGVDGVGSAEDDGLVERHGEDDGLDEDDVGPLEGGGEFGAEGAWVFAFEVVGWFV